MRHATEKDNARALGMAMGAMMCPKGRWRRPDREVDALTSAAHTCVYRRVRSLAFLC
jgi:hypothetical protein